MTFAPGYANTQPNAPPSNDPADRMRQRAAAMTDTGAALKKLADAKREAQLAQARLIAGGRTTRTRV